MYYRYNNLLFGSAVGPSQAAFEWSPPKQVLAGIYDLRTETGVSYDVVRQGERFLMIRLSADSGVVQSLRLIVNWAREIK